MFDQRDDPQHLMNSLAAFLRHWYGSPPGWYGIAPEKLERSRLPDPLRNLYKFAGNWPGDNYWESAFSHQDVLLPFELMRMSKGQLVFAMENQGIWNCGTSAEGVDPPVLATFDDSTWQPVCDSLAQFLVTFCLQETMFGARFVAHGRGLLVDLQAAGRHCVPLWLNGPFVNTTVDFHLVDSELLLMGDSWCASNDEETARSLPQWFKEQAEPPVLGDPLQELPTMPESIRKYHLERLAAEHEEQADLLSRRAASYRRIAESLKGFESDL